MEAIHSSETWALTRATRRHVQEDGILHVNRLFVAVIAVGILFIIWRNIGKCGQDHSTKSTSCQISGEAHSNLVIHADCHSANKGLFAGLIVLVGSIVSIILFCIAMADK
jgi:hypothetical protein